MTFNRELLKDFYKDHLFYDIMPFWCRNLADREFGGYHTCLRRDGSVYDYDKLCMWNSGRMIWVFSHLYNECRAEREWLELASWGMDFVEKHAFAPDGRAYYSLARDGSPLAPPMEIAGEYFMVLGYCEFAKASGKPEYYAKAKKFLAFIYEKISTGDPIVQTFLGKDRKVHKYAYWMLLINLLQTMRDYENDLSYNVMIDECVERIRSSFIKNDRKIALEMVAWDGSELPGHYGRWIKPGHMIEGGIFIIHEGRFRGDKTLIELGLDLIKWGFEWGWDKDFGGIWNDVDILGEPVPSQETMRYPAKFWWQHTEALYGALLAYSVDGEISSLNLFEKTHDYCFEKFSDSEFGEWYSTLDREGGVLSSAKGNDRKSGFHLVRNLFWCYQLLEDSANFKQG